MKAESTFSLKDRLFNAGKVDYLASLLEGAHPGFPGEAFRSRVISALPELELKERIAHIADTLRDVLPSGYPDALEVILNALPPELDPGKTDDDFGDFIIAPFSHFVAMNGCIEEHLSLSLAALREITKRFTVEDAVRYFLNAFPAETMAFLRECGEDDNYHVRRLASEGTRPLLPWAQRVAIDYREPIPILDGLFGDRTRYVTRSVANHLNDVSKLDASLVLATLERWRAEGRQSPKEMGYITKHALRTLLKQGNPEALNLLGFGGKPDVAITELASDTPQVRIGEPFRFTVTVQANRRQNLWIDYLMDFAAGGRKVFRLKQVELEAGEAVTVTKSHPMRLMTTRRLTPGTHQISLQVNGHQHGTLSFELLPPR